MVVGGAHLLHPSILAMSPLTFAWKQPWPYIEGKIRSPGAFTTPGDCVSVWVTVSDSLTSYKREVVRNFRHPHAKAVLMRIKTMFQDWPSDPECQAAKDLDVCIDHIVEILVARKKRRGDPPLQVRKERIEVHMKSLELLKAKLYL